MVFVWILVQLELLRPMDIVPESVIQKVTSLITSVILHAQLDSTSELMLHVLLNAQLDMSKMLKSVNLYHKIVLQLNSIMLKLEFALLVPTHVLNASMLTTIVQLVLLDSHLYPVNVLNLTLVELESTEILQVHVELALLSVLNVSVLLNVPLVQLDLYSMELIVS